MAYLSALAESPTVYNPFNLVLVDLTPSPAGSLSSYTRGKAGHAAAASEGPTPVPERLLGVSNSPLSRPFKKTEAGTMRLGAVVADLADTTEKRSELIEALFEMMRDSKAHYPDPQMDRQGGHPERNVKLSSIFVDTDGYGTRMQTVILIDDRDKATFVERTKTEAGDGLLGAWTETRHDFDLEPMSNE